MHQFRHDNACIVYTEQIPAPFKDIIFNKRLSVTVRQHDNKDNVNLETTHTKKNPKSLLSGMISVTQHPNDNIHSH